MSKELEKIKENELTPITKETIKQFLAPDANEQELTLFVELCKSQGLNPFIKEAYLVVYKLSNGTRKSSIITGKDVFTKRASEHPSFEGLKAGVIVFRENKIVYQEGAFKLSSDKLIGGWAEVYKKGFKNPFREEVCIGEYSSNQSTWRQMPLTMIRKVALVHALREAFPEKFAGLYDESELSAIQGQTIDMKIKKTLDEPKINESELKKLKNAIEASTKTEEQILEALKVESLEDIAQSKLSSIMNRLIELTNENN